MAELQVEFDYAGRTYVVQSPSITMWSVYRLAELNTSMTLETDLRTGQKIFVTWSEVGVIRLLSSIDADGLAVKMPALSETDG
jgi:hypothetical protein